ncbi:MAG: CPBP family intramembrane metalloprotease [Clostridia bacterium]|nr:CPBP family intramembrane metalloprotease [Clostridia bacterium]
MKQEKQEKRGVLAGFLGEPTPSKASGFAFTLAAILPQVLFFAVLAFAPAAGEEKPDWYLYASFLVPQLSFALVALLVKNWKGESLKASFKAQTSCKKRYYFIAVAMQIGLLSLSYLNAWFLQLLGGIGYVDEGIDLPSLNGFGFVGVLVTVALLPAIFEEIFFRGVLLSGLKSFGMLGGALLCGALFSLYHENPAQTVYQFVCGFAFAWAAIKAGSILPTVLAHFLNNAFVLFTEKFGYPPALEYALLILSITCLIFTVVWFAVFDREQNEPAKGDKSEKVAFFKWSAIGIGFCLLVWILALATGIVG